MPGVLYISAKLPKTFVAMKASKLYKAYRVFFFFLTNYFTQEMRKCSSKFVSMMERLKEVKSSINPKWSFPSACT